MTEILPLLASLGTEDLKMVREEEAAGKARASILSRIDGLLARDVPASRRARAPPSVRPPRRRPRPPPACRSRATTASPSLRSRLGS